MPPRPAAAHADIDESIRESPPGHYVLAAAIVDDDQADVLRHMLRSLIPRGAARFHWHEVPAANRLEMCHVLASTDLRHVVAVATPLDPKRQERVCLSATSWRLNDQGVYRLQLETRRQRDANDRRFLLGEQRANRLPLALQYEFGHPNQEPLLWVPDAVAGAIAAALAGGETRYLEAFGRSVDVLHMRLYATKRGERPLIGVAGAACQCTVRQSSPVLSSSRRR